jgi:hypothetical protein
MRTAFNTLMFQTPEQDTRAFLIGSLGIRDILHAREGSTVLLPLRGAMPMFWAADGLPEAEEPVVDQTNIIEVPVGTYNYMASGAPSMRSPSKRAKRGIIDKALETAALHSQDELTLMDEIQGGGTVLPFVKGTLRFAQQHDLKLPLHLIAAEDTRAVERVKTPGYRRMAANGFAGVMATIVRLPLIGLDKDALLDRVIFAGTAGSEQSEDEYLEGFSVERNTDAERLFRSLGSMVRHPEITHDDDFIRRIFDPLATESPEAVDRLQPWLDTVLRGLQD